MQQQGKGCLPVTQIVSDKHHSRHFVCGCGCQRLADRYCSQCGKISCGICSHCGGTTAPIQNPLLIAILADVQVACVKCDWKGGYGAYSEHMAREHAKEDVDEMWNELDQLDITGNSPDGDDDGDDDLKNYNDWNTSINSDMGFWSQESDSEDGEEDLAKELERTELKLAARSSKKPPRQIAVDDDDSIDEEGSFDPFDANNNNSRKSRKDSRKKDSPDSTARKQRSSKGSRSCDNDRGNRSRNYNKNEVPKPKIPTRGSSNGSDPGLSERENLIRQAERYKKQANAKFNKGEFSASRGLYSKGIRTMDQITDATPQDQELLANMLSNRAVTYFREKQFDRTIEDCDTAIRLQPKADKPYIRKWRALMAKGAFEDAYNFIRLVANQTLPESEKLQHEYKKCHVEMGALQAVKGFMNKGDISNAQATLDNILATKDCDNIVLFVYSARLRITVGDFQPALEKINNALRFNPDFVDALECRGFLYFFSGDMEKAANFLYDAYTRHKDCDNLKSAMDRVQATQRYVRSAEEAAAAGKPTESIELYGKAIQASQPIPPLALLCAHLYTARAKQQMEQHQYMAALQDCQTILQVRPKYGPAWAMRAKVMSALGKPEHAYRELQQQQSSWAKDDPDVSSALKEIEFELRVLREHQTINNFCEELMKGDARRLLRQHSMRSNNVHKRTNSRDLSRHNTSLSNNNNINSSSSHKMTMPDGATIVTGKTKDLLKASSTRDFGSSSNNKKSSSSRNPLSHNKSMSNFDLKNLTDVNETLHNDPMRRSKQRKQGSMRDVSGDQIYRKSSRKSNSTSQLKL